MCGIAAIFNYATGEPVERAELIMIRDSMASRGPDGAGEWFSPDGRVGVGHRRLAIIDPSENGSQPMVAGGGRPGATRGGSETTQGRSGTAPGRWRGTQGGSGGTRNAGPLAVVFNGEIYNHRELRAELEERGYRFWSACDTEVLLHLYAAEGERMTHKLRGMYALAIWDEERNGLFLARDPYGIKPLYYADNGKTIRVASQAKALLAGGQIDTSPEAAGHVGFFLWGHVPEPYTLYRGIRALPAGHSLWIHGGGIRRETRFGSIGSILAEAEQANDRRNTARRDPGAQEVLREALEESIRYHLAADVPVGVFLSAGLDSSTLAALAAQEGGILRTVTLGFDAYRGTPQDETPLAENVARQYGTQHQTIWVTRADFRDHLDRLFKAMDQPSTDGVNTYFVSYAAARTSLKVALSGLGGDELFGGYPSFGEIPRSVRSLALFKLSAFRPLGVFFRRVSGSVLRRFTSPKYASLFEYGGTFSGAYLLRRGMFMPWELPRFLDPDMVRAGWQELQPLARLEATVQGLTNPRLKVSCLESCWYLRNQLLRDSDWAGMAHSLEIRTPLVDVRLLRRLSPLLAGATPPAKHDLALAPRSALPSAVLNRPKTGFSIPVREWLLAGLQDLGPQDGEIPRLRESGTAGLAGFGRRDGCGTRWPEFRGLRGWARVVYRQFPGACGTEGKSRKRRLKGLRILVFRIGQLGDTIAALPAIWAVKDHFSNAHLSLLCDRHPGKKYVLASDLFRRTGIFDEYLSYPVAATGEMLRPWRMGVLLAAIRRRHFDILVYLAPTHRSADQVARDRRFFTLAGIRRFIGMEGFTVLPAREDGGCLARLPSESELLLRRVSASGVAAPAGCRGRMDLRLGAAEQSEVGKWLASLEPDGGRDWVAVGPGSKMPSKRWPLDRFEEVIRRLVGELDIWPVVFGGDEDRVMGEGLLKALGRGYNAAGALGLRQALAALRRCSLFLGNDTGTMHMAASVGVPCVAVFSSRDHPGLWYPPGEGHRVFRSPIECEGCGLVDCRRRGNECLKRISAAEVAAACKAVWRTRREVGRGGRSNPNERCRDEEDRGRRDG